jgi:hypothetical protein
MYPFAVQKSMRGGLCLLLLCCLGITGRLRAQSREPLDSLQFAEKTKLITDPSKLAENTLLVARSFLGLPYVSGTLDRFKEEQLVVNFKELDCWTLVELSLAIALTVRDQGSYTDFKTTLTQLRYWGGNILGYGSRIHYFSGWVIQAEKNGYIWDVTKELGGIPYQKEINYISLRPNKYPKIKSEAIRKVLVQSEVRISRHPRFYIPQDRVRAMEHLLNDGDIIMLTSVKPGLDISHEGFAVHLNGRVHLLHASSLNKKVIISRQPLSEYVLSQRGQNGIIVARPRPR